MNLVLKVLIILQTLEMDKVLSKDSQNFRKDLLQALLSGRLAFASVFYNQGS